MKTIFRIRMKFRKMNLQSSRRASQHSVVPHGSEPPHKRGMTDCMIGETRHFSIFSFTEFVAECMILSSPAVSVGSSDFIFTGKTFWDFGCSRYGQGWLKHLEICGF